MHVESETNGVRHDRGSTDSDRGQEHLFVAGPASVHGRQPARDSSVAANQSGQRQHGRAQPGQGGAACLPGATSRQGARHSCHPSGCARRRGGEERGVVQ